MFRTLTIFAFPLLYSLIWSDPAPLLQHKYHKWVAPQWADTLINPLNSSIDETGRGRSHYNKICIVCHGDGGKGDGESSFSLSIPPGDLTSPETKKQSDGALFWKITTGRHPMPGYVAKLSIEERWLLVNYIRLLSKNAEATTKKTSKQKSHEK